MQQEMIYIHTIYQEGSFSKASEKLYLTQSALSMAVHRVEEQLGDSIFDRSKRPVQLTPVGKIYIQKFYEIQRLEKELTEQINDLSNLKGGTLILGGTQYIFSYILAPVLLKYASKYPEVDIQLVECSSNQLDDKLLDGSIDLCLKCDEVFPNFTSCGHAFYDHLFLAMHKSYIEQYHLPNTNVSSKVILNGDFDAKRYKFLPSDYWNELPLLLLTSGNNLHERTLELFRNNNAIPNISLKLQQMVTAYHLAIGGLGATLTSNFIIKKNSSENAVYYKIDSPLMTRDFKFIMNKKGYISKTVYKFMEMTRAYYSDQSSIP